MFRGVSQCIPAVGITLVHSTPSITLPYPSNSLPQFFNSFQYTSFHSLPSQMLCFTILLMLYHSLILFSFPSFLVFHRVVPLLQTCSTYEFVHDHVYFYVYVCLLGLSCMRENMWPFIFRAWLTSFNIMSSNCIHLPSNHKPLLLMIE
jgi:hypothetical protein